MPADGVLLFTDLESMPVPGLGLRVLYGEMAQIITGGVRGSPPSR